jgi:outer membrane immunogenic protein
MNTSLTRTVCWCFAAALSLAVVSSLSAGSESSGKEMKQVAPAPPPECNWTGFYIGLHGGYGWGDTESSGTGDAFDEPPNGGSVSLDPEGAILGGQAGYNWQFGQFVVGLEVKGGWLDLDDSKFIVPSPDNFATVDYNWYALITPRVGFAWNKLLIYAKGGVAFVDVENRAGDLVDFTPTIDTVDLTEKDDTEVGWTVGGGLEYMLNCHWTVGVEYDYLGNLDRGSTNSEDDHFNHDNTAHLVTGRLSYKF